MKRLAPVIFACLVAAEPLHAGSVVAARTLRAQTVITEQDITLLEDVVPGAVTDPQDIIGLETRVAIYPGRPIHLGDLQAPAIVERNQVISVAYQHGALFIQTEGRALERGAIGDTIKVMNATSKVTVSARIGADGIAYVSHP